MTTLEDRFERYETPVHITGIQAIARVVVEQQRRAARLPEIVCGYEQLKPDSAARFTSQLTVLVPPQAAPAGAAAGSVRNHHDGQE